MLRTWNESGSSPSEGTKEIWLLGELIFGVLLGGEDGGVAGTDKSGADWAWGSGGNGGDNGRSDSGDCDDTVERA